MSDTENEDVEKRKHEKEIGHARINTTPPGGTRAQREPVEATIRGSGDTEFRE